MKIYRRYIAPECQRPVYLDTETKRRIVESICTEEGHVAADCFDEAQKVVALKVWRPCLMVVEMMRMVMVVMIMIILEVVVEILMMVMVVMIMIILKVVVEILIMMVVVMIMIILEVVVEMLEAEYFPDFLTSQFHAKHQVDVLTSGQVLLADILYNDTALFHFMEFLEAHNQRLVMEFWLAAINFSQAVSRETEECQNDAMVLYDKFLSMQVDILAKSITQRRSIILCIQSEPTQALCLSMKFFINCLGQAPSQLGLPSNIRLQVEDAICRCVDSCKKQMTFPYLIFVIFFTQAKFLENEIYTVKRVNYDKLHSKLPIFRVKSEKIYTG